MSLVAYGASDDSGESDEEAPLATTHLQSSSSTIAVNTTVPCDNNNSHVKIDGQPTMKVDDLKPVEDSISDEDESSHLLKGLPAPKQPVNVRLDVAEDDVLEDMVKAKPSQLSHIPQPAKTREKGRQSVKITVPALISDLDEDEPQRKKFKKTAKGSGLFSLLPAPRNVSLKEANRILLPNTLKKTENVEKSTEKVSAKMSGDSATVKLLKVSAVKQNDRVSVRPLVNVETGSDSDDDGVSFFSLPEATSRVASTVASYEASNSVIRLPNPQSSNVTDLGASDNRLPGDTHDCPQSSQDISSENNSTSQDLPLSFKSNPFSESPSVPTFGQSQNSYPSYSGHPQYHHGYPTTEEYLSEQGTGESEVDQLLQDEEFLKLQGKSGRGREQVKFIDVDTNQFTGTQDLMKTLTVEKEHTAHRKKDNQPSGRQRSKHQITYLAFQAKERELTLKNQWSQNRQTKRQTQSKYGF